MATRDATLRACALRTKINHSPHTRQAVFMGPEPSRPAALPWFSVARNVTSPSQSSCSLAQELGPRSGWCSSPGVASHSAGRGAGRAECLRGFGPAQKTFLKPLGNFRRTPAKHKAPQGGRIAGPDQGARTSPTASAPLLSCLLTHLTLSRCSSSPSPNTWQSKTGA